MTSAPRWALLVAAILLGGMLAIATGATPAAAHAEFLGSSPEDRAVLDSAPERAELRFNEPVQLIDGAIRLFPADGGDPFQLLARASETTVLIELPQGLDDGSYALSYRVISADSHPLGGAITFRIGEGVPGGTEPDFAGLGDTPAATEWLVSALTAGQYLALLILAGLLLFDGVVLRTGRSAAPKTLVAGVYVAAAVFSLLLIPASAFRVTGAEPPEILTPDLWRSGLTVAPILAAAVVTAVGAAAAYLGTRSPGGSARVLAPALAGVALAAPVLVGHTRTREPAWAMITADLGHLAAGAFWTGGVIGLLLFLRVAGAESAGQVVVRFSRFALTSVAVLVLSGAIMANLILDSWEALLATSYGRTLLLKLGIVAAVAGLAAWNRTRLLPRITAHPTAAQQWTSLRRILSYEAALLVAVITITGFLTNISPGQTHQHGAQETALSVESQGLTVEGTLSPTMTGLNVVAFRLSYDGEPVTPEQVTILARLPEQDLGPFTSTPELGDAGEYQASLNLPVSGEWQLQVSARIDTYTEPIVIFTLTVP